ncbi:MULTISPECIES: DUF1304 domain-containing protein [Microbacterium]|uniref:DUF1304 domain-containing protein n=1 Tax=Microbacterium TaxID=33882 RepID=UPI00214C9153|nr:MULTISPECIES: DUF1304 domain-containing protein [unclassified Microbacterium]MCR2813798.1 DUF1304 domain-containing protein [Microbacterium sp. zg.Y1084]MDL5487536.1 DUF1304 domain-containing protein [Microbacterium sp. zg-Y1211]
MAIAGIVVAALAAVLHVVIFTMESVLWTRPPVWQRFGVADQAAAETTRSMAYNQGFYNLFLAVGAALGAVLYGAAGAGGDTPMAVAGYTLMLFSLGSMLAAAVVLVTTGARYLRPAAVQGTLPLIGIVLLLVAR